MGEIEYRASGEAGNCCLSERNRISGRAFHLYSSPSSSQQFSLDQRRSRMCGLSSLLGHFEGDFALFTKIMHGTYCFIRKYFIAISWSSSSIGCLMGRACRLDFQWFFRLGGLSFLGRGFVIIACVYLGCFFFIGKKEKFLESFSKPYECCHCPFLVSMGWHCTIGPSRLGRRYRKEITFYPYPKFKSRILVKQDKAKFRFMHSKIHTTLGLKDYWPDFFSAMVSSI